MDEIDLRILRECQAKPDIALSELAGKIGLSQTPCWRRLKRLEQTGVIRGRALLLDPIALGLSVNVFADVKLKSHHEEALDQFEFAVAQYPQIIECFSMSGENDYLLRIVLGSIDDYEKFLKRELVRLPGVASVNSSFALKCVKDTSTLPF